MRSEKPPVTKMTVKRHRSFPCQPESVRTKEPHMLQQQSVSLEEARLVIAAAEKKALEIGQPMNIAVVCAGGHLLAFERMAGAWLGSVDISIKKAWTSRSFDIETKTLS